MRGGDGNGPMKQRDAHALLIGLRIATVLVAAFVLYRADVERWVLVVLFGVYLLIDAVWRELDSAVMQDDLYGKCRAVRQCQGTAHSCLLDIDHGGPHVFCCLAYEESKS